MDTTAMIDFEKEEPLSFAEAAKHVPGHPHVSTLHRWSRSGIRGIRLESFWCVGRRMTSLQALKRFLQRVNAVGQDEVLVPGPHFELEQEGLA
jgi:hypothetical protein